MYDKEAVLAKRGIVASAAVLAREGSGGMVTRILGEDGLGRTFDALVASGTVAHVDLLATAVERSHEYYGIPAVLTAGAARSWAHGLPDEAADELMYHEAGEAFEKAQAAAITASAKATLRKRVAR